uniref:Uncharacterized protein n=1 Tax=Ditylenchus dipsaci TaxID=166011 RepID=A0A915E8S8_9BILA
MRRRIRILLLIAAAIALLLPPLYIDIHTACRLAAVSNVFVSLRLQHFAAAAAAATHPTLRPLRSRDLTTGHLPQSSFNFAAFGGQYPQPASTSMTCNANFDHMAAMSASSSSNVNDVNAFAAAAAAANQQHSNNELKMMNECMMAEAASSKRPDNNNVFGLSNIQEMDVMKLFQKNALIQPGFGDMEEKMSAATKEQMQSNQLINGMKRQMVMPNSMNAALQSYHEQLAACMPPAAKRVANSNAYHMPAISQANASIAQMSMPITNGQSLMAGNGNANPHANMMHPNLMGMTSTPSNFMMANNGSSINSMAQSMAQHNMMSQQMPPVSSYPNLGALNGTMNGNNSAAAMSLQQQQQQQNFQLAAMNHQKQQNQLKAQQQMLQQQAKMHPQAAAMAQAQAAARAQAIREAQIMQQHQQRQQKLAASAMVAAPLPSSPQQGMNAQDYLTQRQLAEYTNLLRFQQAQQQQQQQANLQQQHQQQQQMAQQQLMQQHQQAALLAAAQQEQQRRKASSNPSLVPMTTQ